ncbi:MAG: cysteine desulfurase family protein [Candidatus Nanopelagicales bacterium]
MAYLDHAATTPMLPEAVAAMTAELVKVGNPSSLHGSGRKARRVVEEARETIAAAVCAKPMDVVFTSGGTEANNLAIKGLFWARKKENPKFKRVLISAIEHHAVLDPVLWLGEHENAEVEILEVSENGILDPQTLRESIAKNPEDVALISVMWANNEVGTIQPIAELSEIANDFKIPFHSDAVQAMAYLPIDLSKVNVAALTITGHKVGGPQGVGALIVKSDTNLEPMSHGGGQERDVRSGTLDAPAISGFASAVSVLVSQRERRSLRIKGLRDEAIKRIKEVVPEAVVNGDLENRLPGNVHISFPGCEGDALLMLLDAHGVECSTGSACNAGIPQPSHVLLAMGRDERTAKSSLRFSLGHSSTIDDIDELITALPPVVERAKRASTKARITK